MGAHLSTARSAAPWIVAIASLVSMLFGILVGAPGADDIASWRWIAVRPA